MRGYAIGHLRNVRVGDEIVEYLKRIDATLEPFGGAFLIHGAQAQCVEGKWTGDMIVIAFPSIKAAQDWYNSPVYRAIAPLRACNADGEILLIEGVEEPHRATDVLKGLLPA